MAGKKLRVAIGGYGRSGCDIHARWLREDPKKWQIVAVADQLAPRRKDAERDFGCATFKDYKELLKNVSNKDVDLFVNALPSHLHSKGTVDAFAKKHNVVCEKPLARKVKDFDEMVAAAKKARKLFAPFQNGRFYPFLTKMRQVIDSGILGEIIHIRSAWSGFGRRWDWQTLQEFGGGNLLNTGPHPMDHAIMLFGPRKPKVFCQMRSNHTFGGDAEDFVSVTLYGKGSPMIEVTVSSCQAYSAADQYVISGTYGGMTGGPAGLKWKYFNPNTAPKHKMWKPWSLDRGYCREQLKWIEKSWEPSAATKDSFQYNSKAFYNNVYAALTKGAKLVVQPSEVRRQIEVIEECHRQNPLPKRRKR